MIWIGPYGILPALRTALGHDCRPSAARRAINHDRGPFCGPSKFHNALTNHVIVILARFQSVSGADIFKRLIAQNRANAQLRKAFQRLVFLNAQLR